MKNFAAEQMKVVKSLPASQDGGSPLCRRSNENGVGKFAFTDIQRRLARFIECALERLWRGLRPLR